MHEHVRIADHELRTAFPRQYPASWEAEVELVGKKLRAVKDHGIDTIVDLTAPGLGRDPRFVAEAAAGSGVNVVMCTGWYTWQTLPYWMNYHGPGKLFASDGEDPLVDWFVTDIDEGISGTDIRAGILKCCTDEPGLTPDVERVLRAVARAHLRTGVPITTHTHAPTRRGLDQQRVFREEGVDLSRVVIGHCNESTDLGYFEEMLEAGSYLGFDKFGLNLEVSHEAQIDTVAELCRRGHASRLVLSHDRHCISDWFSETEVASAVPDWHHGYISEAVLPALREQGISQQDIDQMLITNARDILSSR